MHLRRYNRPSRPGATLVESALIISLFLMILFGIFEYGRFLMTKQLMDNAARTGARWAVANTMSGTTTQVQAIVNTALGPAANQLVGYTQSSSISVYAADSSGNFISGTTWSNVAFGANVAVVITGTY